MEVVTGKGVLGQLGIDATAVKGPLLTGLLFLTVGGLVGGWTVIQNPPDINKVSRLSSIGTYHAFAGLSGSPLKYTCDPQSLTCTWDGVLVTHNDRHH